MLPPSETTMVKPSFAKVASSGYVPRGTSHSPTSKSSSNPSVSVTGALPIVFGSLHEVSDDAASPVSCDSPADKDTKEDTRTASEKPGDLCPPGATTGGRLHVADDGSSKALPTDDSSTQVSSSDGSAKLPSFDNKSVASGTTFGLDEKESIRPDDSASIRAVEEEDMFSATGSGAPGSRVGSDSDARAFSDQLREIAVMGPSRGVALDQFQPAVIANTNVPFDPAAAATHQANGNDVSASQTLGVPTPDEKLVEALESPRDRVYVLKIEQDVIDFLKYSKDSQLPLPQTNAFYRMLAHRLADYYGLEHTVEHSGSGAAVVITKTGNSRMPAPLTGFSTPSTVANTPPPAVQARKIMRRGGDTKGNSGLSTASNSEVPSKATSENGGDSSNSDVGQNASGDAKSKMTREEREAKYAEARQRIFGNVDENEADAKDTGDNGNSRSSSTTGKKKTKKQRNDNDDFEPRSQMQTYFPQHAQPNYPTEGYYYPPAPNQQFGPHSSPNSPPVGYPHGFSQMDAQPQFGWMGPQYGVPAAGLGMQSYPQPGAPNFDISAQFQQAMQTFQGASPPNRLPAGPMSAPTNGYNGQYPVQPQQVGPQWQPGVYDSSFQYAQHGYVQSFPDQSRMAPMHPQHVPYPYGQLPNPSLQNGKMTKLAHPLPGSYNRPQFNPQSQTFVPGSRHPQGMHMPAPGMPPFNGYLMPNHFQAGAHHRSTPPASNGSTFGSPRNHHPIPTSHTLPNHGNHMNTAAHSPPAPSSSMPPSAASSAGSSVTANAQQQQQQQGQPHPLPQPPNPASSIAKWGTPAHLPPKPPPPSSMQPQKFIELNPGLQNFPGLPRIVAPSAFGGPNGMGTNGSVNGVGRNGSK
ncbi:hypothetical protein EJ06DRAFT_72354 [Trichodelitschia bisporula]|uniref:R3H domain-containing protein n=1 Tax=Trichodelitschia bisporula TaxID=703511 RepID=A0A6G1HSV6_9PEZI|nr:hypothetical protein EJ06DRAFT_72354 [Trichodelitschia bisporula]